MIRALPGCVIFFPLRAISKDETAIIYGHKSTRRRWREEWVQILIDLVDIEIRLEGDNSFHLGDDLRCEVVAKIQSQVDDSNFPESLPKVISNFLCTTTKDPNEKLSAQFFKQILQRKFRSVVEDVARKASYLDLLEKPTHHTELSSLFETRVRKTLQDCGFITISQSVRFTPVDPGTIGRRMDIARKWMQWELDRARLRSEEEFNRTALEEDNKQKLLDRREETAKMERQFKLREKEAERDYEVAIQTIDVDMAKQHNGKQFQLAEVKKALEDFFNERQRQDIEFKHELRVSELRNQEKEKQIAEEEDRSRVRRNMEDDNEVRARRLRSLADEQAIAESELQIERVACEKLTLRARMESARAEGMSRAAGAIELDMARSREDIMKALFTKLPEILVSLPIEKIGETTMISISKEPGGTEQSLGLGSLGMVAVPLVRRLVDLIYQPSKSREAAATPGNIPVPTVTGTAGGEVPPTMEGQIEGRK